MSRVRYSANIECKCTNSFTLQHWQNKRLFTPLSFYFTWFKQQQQQKKRVCDCFVIVAKIEPYLVAYKSIQLSKRQFNAWFRICVAQIKKTTTRDAALFFGCCCFGNSMNSIDVAPIVEWTLCWINLNELPIHEI